MHQDIGWNLKLVLVKSIRVLWTALCEEGGADRKPGSENQLLLSVLDENIDTRLIAFVDTSKQGEGDNAVDDRTDTKWGLWTE